MRHHHQNEPKRYARRQRLADLAIITLFLVQLPTGKLTAAIFPDLGSPLSGAPLVHAICGGLVMLTGGSLFVQHLVIGVPTPLPMPRSQLWAARIVHSLLFLLMLVVPLTGIAAVARGPEIAPIHTGLVRLTLALITIHAAAALFHHFVQRDPTVSRMFGRNPPALLDQTIGHNA